MEQTRQIDVIVPVYNVKAYLKQCLDSLIAQTIPIQIIIVDDGSTDESSIIGKQYAMKFPQQIIYLEQENAGLSAARNTGIAHSVAPYIAFMDSDDWVSDDYYEVLLSTIQETNADIACSDITFAYENNQQKLKASNNFVGDLKRNYISQEKDHDYKKYLIDIFPMAQNKLWKRELLSDEFRFLKGKQYEDLDFFYRIYPKTKAIAFTNKGTFYYRQRAGSIVKTADNRILDITAVFDNVLDYYKKTGLYGIYKQELDYLIIRNCLVASSKRLAYSHKYYFIRDNLNVLFTYVNDNIPLWRKNNYIKSFSIRNLIIKSFSKKTLGIHAISLLIISLFFRK